MANKKLVLAIFADEAAADSAAMTLKDSGLTSHDAVGILVLDANGKINVDKVGATSVGKGAGIGACLFVLGPAALGVGVLGGAVGGALHHKNLGLSDSDRDRIAKEIEGGKAAVGVMAPDSDGAAISAKLGELGGAVESYGVTDEVLEQAAADPSS